MPLKSFLPKTSLITAIILPQRRKPRNRCGVTVSVNSVKGEDVKNDMIDARFGIARLQGEQLIFAAEPTGFVRYCMVVVAMSLFGIAILPLVWLCAIVAKDKYRYWLTNRRVILSSGFIGFKVRSIPLERISDVSLSRTFPEMLAGVSSLVVRDMTGETNEGKSLLAITDSSEYQRQILDEIRKVNSQRTAV